MVGLITFFGSKIADFLLQQKIISPHVKDIYRYGSELIISFIISVVIVFGIGFLSGKLIECVLFYVVFCVLRTYTGGFHAKSYVACKLTLCIVILCFLYINDILENAHIWYWCALIVFNCVTIAYLSPIENPNKTLSSEQKVVNKKYAFMEIMTFSVISFILMVLGVKIFHVLVLSAFSVSVLMLVTKIETKEGLFYE